jgi:thiamine-monophosphate kinase
VVAKPRLDEFERIARFFAPLAGKGALELKDDAALIDGPAGTQYVLTTDTIVENVHFLADDPPDQIAQKLLRVNLSDLAAKGAKPLGYLLNTALPKSRGAAWLEKFARGLATDQKEFGIVLLGGDSVATAGPITLTVTAIGTVPKGKALLRSGTRAGDGLYVSGTLGDAALGLKILKGELKSRSPKLRRDLVARYRLPEPRLDLGRRLIGIATAAMDISDGLVADLAHLCDASGVGAIVDAEKLPLSPALRAALRADPSLIASVLGGGDDYELLFTAPPGAAKKLSRLPVTEIGRIEAGRDVTVLGRDGQPVKIGTRGYSHF